jgi:threonine/homoserine/homoserine lactone efflux protein
MGPVLLGIVVSLSNPYWSLWWAGIGMTYITKAWLLGIAGLGAFFTGHILADLIWYSAVAGAVTGGRRLMSHRVYRGIIGGCGVFLLWLGLDFIRYAK